MASPKFVRLVRSFGRTDQIHVQKLQSILLLLSLFNIVIIVIIIRIKFVNQPINCISKPNLPANRINYYCWDRWMNGFLLLIILFSIFFPHSSVHLRCLSIICLMIPLVSIVISKISTFHATNGINTLGR